MDQALKQRLIGASILIALAVIFVPMLLDEPVQEEEPANLNIPPRPQPPVHTRRIPAQPATGGDAVTRGADSRGSGRRALTDATRPADRGGVSNDDTRAVDSGTGVALRPSESPASAASTTIDEPAATTTDSVVDEIAARNRSRTPAAGGESSTASTGDSAARDAVTDNRTSDAEPTAAADTSTDDAAVVDDSTTIIDNSPPAATTPASRLITPDESTTSGLIAEDQWALQVASFSATENASRLARQLRDMGFNPNLDTVYRGGAALHRVRVGPFANRQAATAAGTRISSKINDLRPRPVAPRSGDTPASSAASETTAATTPTPPPATPDDGLDRFAVQLGSFAGADNADRLQTRAREAGYPAFVERVDGSQGTRYLVKVGPLLSRNDASATRDRLERELGIKGILVDYL